MLKIQNKPGKEQRFFRFEHSYFEHLSCLGVIVSGFDIRPAPSRDSDFRVSGKRVK
jgi:hypothetical protein